jgi:hypothetical protein
MRPGTASSAHFLLGVLIVSQLGGHPRGKGTRDGQISSALQLWRVQPLQQKYFFFSEMKIGLYDLPSRPERGALAIVTNVGTGCGGRGSARAQQ